MLVPANPFDLLANEVVSDGLSSTSMVSHKSDTLPADALGSHQISPLPSPSTKLN